MKHTKKSFKWEETPILCGGTGLYIEAVLKSYRLLKVPENPILRAALASKPLVELKQKLASLVSLHNNSDMTSKTCDPGYLKLPNLLKINLITKEFDPINSLIVVLDIERELDDSKNYRPTKDLDRGMIEEVKKLLNNGRFSQGI